MKMNPFVRRESVRFGARFRVLLSCLLRAFVPVRYSYIIGICDNGARMARWLWIVFMGWGLLLASAVVCLAEEQDLAYRIDPKPPAWVLPTRWVNSVWF